VSAVGRGFFRSQVHFSTLLLDDWKSPQNDVVILSGRHSHPRIRHFLDDSGKGHFGGLLLGSPFPHKSHDFRNPGSFLVNLDRMALCLKSWMVGDEVGWVLL
jgi:hypothetical protein